MSNQVLQLLKFKGSNVSNKVEIHSVIIIGNFAPEDDGIIQKDWLTGYLS